jgi:hypothetical protein
MSYRQNRTKAWEFRTEQFHIVAYIELEDDTDLSWDDTGEVREKLESGEYEAFGTEVIVYWRGNEIAADYLGGSIYANPRDFFREHRSDDPMNRNCSIMRAANGENCAICHYFPDMVRQVVAEARQALSSLPRLRT